MEMDVQGRFLTSCIAANWISTLHSSFPGSNSVAGAHRIVRMDVRHRQLLSVRDEQAESFGSEAFFALNTEY